MSSIDIKVIAIDTYIWCLFPHFHGQGLWKMWEIINFNVYWTPVAGNWSSRDNFETNCYIHIYAYEEISVCLKNGVAYYKCHIIGFVKEYSSIVINMCVFNLRVNIGNIELGILVHNVLSTLGREPDLALVLTKAKKFSLRFLFSLTIGT